MNYKIYTPSAYAKKKGVNPSRVTHLKDKLVKDERVVGGWMVVDCPENDALFPNSNDKSE